MNYDIRVIIITAALLALTGCADDLNVTLDGHVLCDPGDGKAYSVRRHVGDTAFLHRSENADVLCRKAAQ